MAKELATAGFRVVVLEQGPWRHLGDRAAAGHLASEARAGAI